MTSSPTLWMSSSTPRQGETFTIASVHVPYYCPELMSVRVACSCLTSLCVPCLAPVSLLALRTSGKFRVEDSGYGIYILTLHLTDLIISTLKIRVTTSAVSLSSYGWLPATLAVCSIPSWADLSLSHMCIMVSYFVLLQHSSSSRIHIAYCANMWIQSSTEQFFNTRDLKL